ncbi:MAG: hypothetical protein K6T85_04045 [Gorillibacterium sp.]|nr:hypothetical protein [Gorillibacterium sp.]
MYRYIRQWGMAALVSTNLLIVTPSNAAAPGPDHLTLSRIADPLQAITVSVTAPSKEPNTSVPPGNTNHSLATPVATPSETPDGVADARPISKDRINKDFSTELDSKIKGWIEALSTEPGFAAWKKSSYVMEPLGPGTHAWLVTLRDGETEVGYMIVSYDPEGKIELTEYGPGPNPLFSLVTLRESLSQRGLLASIPQYETTAIRYYLGPLEAFWLLRIAGEPYYFDAKSGETLPDLTKLLPVQSPPSLEAPSSLELLDSQSSIKKSSVVQASISELISPADKVMKQLLTESFDPYDDAGWIVDKPMPLTHFAALADLLQEHKKVIYTIKVYAKQALFPFAVRSTHHWLSENNYFAVEQEGLRYLPFNQLKIGHFYVSP